ncbi:MAG: NAD(P)H-hydrate dehydratase [Chitinophagales bacterium]|nr:NAD(P)H-hydrate dehydratase [Chitinophagales bacterium]MCZ2394760.1 NAD(P)H-hydrate dehydratase [Chitinophagales bacterium]
MKILTASQIREADQYTIQNEPISSIQLMERAAGKVVEILLNEFQSTQRVKHIFCGTGNNGGDGLAIARMIHQLGHQVKVYLLEGRMSEDFSINLKRVKDIGQIECIQLSNISQISQIQSSDIIIDTIFGTGLNKPLEGNIKKIVQFLNQAEDATRIAIDIPTGLLADQHNDKRNVIFQADRVYTFHAPKLAFLLPENASFAQSFKVLDIKLAAEFTENTEGQYYFLQKKDIQQIYRPREKFTHKGTYGHCLIIAGSRGKIGAAILASKAALKSGAGLVTTHLPANYLSVMQSAFPEAMCSTDVHGEQWSELPDFQNKTIAVGPGIGTSYSTQSVFKQLLLNSSKPMIIDADAINLLSKDSTLIRLIPVNSILTPHPKEFERIAGDWENDFERLELQRQFSIKHHLILVLKGAHTSISDPEGNVYFNSTGNSGMATAGSGDVLTGIICSLLAQGYSPKNATILGVYIHGLAGNFALENESKESLIASNIIDNLGKSFLSMKKI